MTPRRIATSLLVWLVVAVMVTFVVYNAQGVSLDLVGASVEAPLGVVVIMAFVLGAISHALIRVMRLRSKP